VRPFNRCRDATAENFIQCDENWGAVGARSNAQSTCAARFFITLRAPQVLRASTLSDWRIQVPHDVLRSSNMTASPRVTTVYRLFRRGKQTHGCQSALNSNVVNAGYCSCARSSCLGARAAACVESCRKNESSNILVIFLFLTACLISRPHEIKSLRTGFIAMISTFVVAKHAFVCTVLKLSPA
jgi:hypothetical protein